MSRKHQKVIMFEIEGVLCPLYIKHIPVARLGGKQVFLQRRTVPSARVEGNVCLPANVAWMGMQKEWAGICGQLGIDLADLLLALGELADGT